MSDKKSTHKPPLIPPQVAALAEGVALLLHPYAEVAVHDVRSDRILAIWNAFSKRKVGDPSLLRSLPARQRDSGHYGPYEKTNWNGKRLKCVSISLLDDQDAPMLMCINFDISAFDPLLQLASIPEQQPAELFAKNWRERINQLTHEWVRSHGLHIETLSQEQRLALVRHLDGQGAFEVRKSIEQMAAILGVSRATAYNLRKAAKDAKA